MANLHVLKNTESEVVLKCYIDDPAGGTITIDVSDGDVLHPNQTFDANTSQVVIKELMWGVRLNKQIDISRQDPVTLELHGHYYLMATGHHNFNGFVDNIYPTGNIVIDSDGAFHLFITLGKSGFPVA